MKQVDGIVTSVTTNDSSPASGGYCRGKIIRRDEIRTTYLANMAETSEETCDLAIRLFDRHGRLKVEFKENHVRKDPVLGAVNLMTGKYFLLKS